MALVHSTPLILLLITVGKPALRNTLLIAHHSSKGRRRHFSCYGSVDRSAQPVAAGLRKDSRLLRRQQRRSARVQIFRLESSFARWSSSILNTCCSSGNTPFRTSAAKF